MNYTYELKNSDYSQDVSEMMIIEYLNDEYQVSWYLASLKTRSINDFMIFYLFHLKDSFKRTRNWTLENHPELLL
jgi:hypothetical protein